jgi:site-specific DNA recombinase
MKQPATPQTLARVLGRVRLSLDREESTSVERQREVIEQWAQAQGHRIVGWAEDINVSGSVDPFDTPALGPWLDDRAPEWDVICAWKLDRLGRDAIRLNKLFGWAIDHGKIVVSATEGIDLGTPVGRLIANVIAFLAEGELEAIRERTKASRAKLRQAARWPGGKPPYGYRAVALDGGGWKLEIDEEARAVIQRIVGDLLDGATLTGEARTLTSEGVRTPADHYRAQRGLEPIRRKKTKKIREWRTTPLRNLLRSPALLGRVHHDGELVRDDDGLPVQIGEPLVSVDDWERVQSILDGNQEARKDARRSSVSMLTGLVFCAACGELLHHDLNTVRRPNHVYEYRYLRCKARCSPQIPAEEVENLAEDAFLEHLGGREVRERMWVPGDDNQEAMAEAVRAVDQLSAAAGRATSTTMRQRLQRQLDALDARIADLEQAPAREARWEWRSTGGTYGDAWKADDDVEARRRMLQRSGITFTARVVGGRGSKAREFHIRIPEGATTEPVELPTDPELDARIAAQQRRGGAMR